MRTLRVLVVLTATLCTLALPGTAPARAAPVALSVELTQVTPVLTADGVLRLTGRVHNTGETTIDQLSAAVWVNQTAMTTRREVALAAAEDPGDRLGVRFSSEEQDVNAFADTVDPGGSARFSVQLPVSRLGLTGRGVFIVGVDVRGTPHQQARDTLGRARTFVTWPPAARTMGSVEVAAVLPVTASPATSAAGDIDGRAELLDAVSSGGRLTRTARLAGTAGVNLAVDPATLADLATLAAAHREDGVDVPANTGAAGVLGALRSTLADSSRTVVLPYRDPDLASLDRARLVQRLPEIPALSTAAATSAGVDPDAQVSAWPASGYADAATLEEMVLAGIDQVMLSARALPELPAAGPRRSPVVTVATSEGPIEALVYDPVLFAGGRLDDDSPLIVRQRYLAEALLLAMRTPHGRTTRTVAVLDRDQGQPVDLGQVLAPPRAAGWLHPASLRDVAAAGPSGPTYTGRLRYPASVKAGEFDAAMVAALQDLSDAGAALQSLSSGTADGSLPTTAPAQATALRTTLTQRFLAGASTSWRSRPDAGRAFVRDQTDQVRSQLDDIRLTVPRFATLSGSSGAFPLTVANGLDQQVTVSVRLTPLHPGVMEPVEQQTFTVDGRRKHIERVTAHAAGTGVVRVEATIVAPNGATIGVPQLFTLRATTYGWWGWVILGTGLALFVAAILFRRHRVRRRADTIAGELRVHDGGG